MKITIKTIPELRKAQGIEGKDMIGVGTTLQTYHNIISGKTKPTQKTIEKFCILFDIDEKTFNRLLKNTVPKV